MAGPEALQFKILLKRIRPPIWRRIHVPSDYTFWDLHVAIQDAMGWDDYHPHEFVTKDLKTGSEIRIGIPDDEAMFWGVEILPEWEILAVDYFSQANPKAIYRYDFGDGWEHTITLEKKVPLERGADYPRCLGGRRACSPEDCGGPYGYESLLESITNPEDANHETRLEWVGAAFDAEHFDPEEIIFNDSRQRSKSVLERE